MAVEWLGGFAGLGFAEINPKEKEVNSLTQTVFYNAEMMLRQSYRMEYEFEKECINQVIGFVSNRSRITLYIPFTDGKKYTP